MITKGTKIAAAIAKFTNNTDIEKVLTKESYVYLPEVAKNYIISYYNETGTILKTEKNKVINEPYLNPDYVKYLELGSKEVSDYIPSDTLVDYDYSKVEVGSSLPSKYDSRNVNGKSYVTSNKDQKSSSLCWDFSVTSVLESKILKTGLYSGSAELDLSERQIDYATTDPNSGVDIQFNPYFFDYQLDTLMGGGNSKRYFYRTIIFNLIFYNINKISSWHCRTIWIIT